MKLAPFALTCALLFLATPSPSAQTVFPEGTTVWDPLATEDGYTFYGSPNGVATLIDMDGTVVNTWQSPDAGEPLVFAEPLDNGNVFIMSQKPDIGFWAQKTGYELDWNGNVVWSYTVEADVTSMHHDFERLASGNSLILLNYVRVIGGFNVLDDRIVEVDRLGNIVWQWDLFDHFGELGFNVDGINHVIQGALAQDPFDWAHANSIATIPANTHTDPALAEGNIIVSCRHINTVFIIDRNTGQIVWKTGPNNPLTLGQHHATMIPQGFTGAGNILMYDNGCGTGWPVPGIAPAISRGVELDPVTMTEVWDYSAVDSGQFDMTFFSNIVGSAQRLSNGNTLLIEGVDGRIFEVDDTGAIVWEYMTDQAGVNPAFTQRLIYRAFRLPYSWAPAP